MNAPRLPARFFFRFSAPCRYRDPLWTPAGAALGEEHRLIAPALLDAASLWADVRAAWSEAGLAFVALVRGSGAPPRRDGETPEDADGLHLWIDTRDVHNVHRAGRFCHRFAVLPGTRPTCEFLPIHRAREQPNPIRPGLLRAHCQRLENGYNLEALIPAEALTGFDPAEHPRLGFTYAVIDGTLGEQTFSVGSPLPYCEDPSLWATLELVR